MGRFRLRQVIVQHSSGLLKLPANIVQAVPTYYGVFCDLCGFRSVPGLFPCIHGVGQNPATGQAENAFGDDYRIDFDQKSVHRQGKHLDSSRLGRAFPGWPNLAGRSFE